jgi:hypothetical protein
MMPYYEDKAPRPVHRVAARTLPFFAALSLQDHNAD